MSSSSASYERAQEAARLIRTRTNAEPSVAVVLGSGLGAFAGDLKDATAIPYEDIPGFARSTVEGHAGRLVIGKVGETTIAAMQGRFHYYEGYPLDDVTFPIRVLKMLGVRTLVLTNAAGGINSDFTPGTLMVITDHINFLGSNPLYGANDPRFGPRFPDMSEVYSVALQKIILDEGRAMNVTLRSGVYIAFSGPSYETPAEIRMARALGADAVGISTVPEAIVARHMDMRVAAISCITNLAAGVSKQPLSHAEVMETGERVRGTFTELLRRILPKFA